MAATQKDFDAGGNDSDSSFDVESIQSETVEAGDTATLFFDIHTQLPLESGSVITTGEPSETLSRAKKNAEPGIVKIGEAIYRAWNVIDNGEDHMYVERDLEAAHDLCKVIFPKKTLTYTGAQKARRAIAKAIKEDTMDELKTIVMCSATIEHVLKSQKPRKRVTPAEPQEASAVPKRLKMDTLEPPKSPMALKRVKSMNSPVSSPKKKKPTPQTSIQPPAPPPDFSGCATNPTANYTITKMTQTVLSVPTLGELKEAHSWSET
jgi:hypothetical protein